MLTLDLALAVPMSVANTPLTATRNVIQHPKQHCLVNQVHAADNSAVSA